MKIRGTIAVGLMALAVGACGGGSSDAKQQVQSSFNTLMRDLSNQDPAACTLFSKRYALENTGQSNYQVALSICRRHIQGGSVTVPKGLKVAKVNVKGNSATVKATAPGQGSGIFHFVNENGHWKVDSVTAK
jgi:hypothetical protein